MNEQASDQASDAQNSPANGMEMYDRNVDAIAAFIESGCIADEGALGIELEHIIVREDGSPVNYSGEDGIQSVLEVLRADYPQATYDAEGDLLGVARRGEAVTIEPAAQVELSAGPFMNWPARRRASSNSRRSFAARSRRSTGSSRRRAIIPRRARRVWSLSPSSATST